MYEAKEAGRDRFALYRPPTNGEPRLSSRLADAERIRRALAQDQFELYCQPILDLATNEVSQYELLLRLRTDEGELLQPSAFLYVAERFGTILTIDCWVVRQAVALIASQARIGRPLTFNVNLSAKPIGDPLLVAVIDQELARARIDPACLVFELTETAAIGNMEHAKTFTTELRSRGCRFALDDFGSGFGSFYYLKHLPFDYFKIDGDFIRGFGANTTDELVVEAIVGIAKGMGKKTVAEFVTDQEMMDRLRRSGVDYAQGFIVGGPQPIGELFAQPDARLIIVALAVAAAFSVAPASVRRLPRDNTSTERNDPLDGPGTLRRNLAICAGELTSVRSVSTSLARCTAVTHQPLEAANESHLGFELEAPGVDVSGVDVCRSQERRRVVRERDRSSGQSIRARRSRSKPVQRPVRRPGVRPARAGCHPAERPDVACGPALEIRRKVSSPGSAATSITLAAPIDCARVFTSRRGHGRAAAAPFAFRSTRAAQ